MGTCECYTGFRSGASMNSAVGAFAPPPPPPCAYSTLAGVPPRAPKSINDNPGGRTRLGKSMPLSF